MEWFPRAPYAFYQVYTKIAYAMILEYVGSCYTCCYKNKDSSMRLSMIQWNEYKQRRCGHL